jgi:hypothetical protein
MFEIRIAEVVKNIIEQEFENPMSMPVVEVNGNTSKVRGILFCLNFEISEFEKDKHLNKDFYILASRKKIWIAQDKFNYMKPIPDCDKWNNTCNHDSCWAIDGIESPINKIYFEMCSKVNNDVAPVKLHAHTSFNLWFIQRNNNKIFKDVEITYEKEKDAYGYKILNIE